MLKISFDQKYIYPLEENHRFPMIKYELIPEQLIRENTCCDDNFFSPKQILDKDVLLTHEVSYFQIHDRVRPRSSFTRYCKFKIIEKKSL